MFEEAHSRFPMCGFICEWRVWTTPGVNGLCLYGWNRCRSDCIRGLFLPQPSGQILRSCTDVVARCGSGRLPQPPGFTFSKLRALVSESRLFLFFLFFSIDSESVWYSGNTVSVFPIHLAHACVCFALFVCQWPVMLDNRAEVSSSWEFGCWKCFQKVLPLLNSFPSAFKSFCHLRLQ